MLKGNTFEISMRVPLSNYFLNQKEADLENFSVNDIWTLTTLTSHLEFAETKSNAIIKKKLFWFFSLFLKSPSNFKYFEKNITLRVYVFPKLQAVKDMVWQMFK